MVTQTEVNTAFQIGQTRMHDVCELIEDGMIGHAEVTGMMMGALVAHAKRRGKGVVETAIEFAELLADELGFDDE